MHKILFLSATLLTLALAAPGAAEEPRDATPAESSEATAEAHAELLERLDRYQAKLTRDLQRRLEARINPQISAELSSAFERPKRSHHAGGETPGTGASIARTR